MKQTSVELKHEFKVLLGNKGSQAAEMVIAPGQKEGGPDNRPRGRMRGSTLWPNEGVAVVNSKKHKFSEESLVIECGDTHKIGNIGRTELKTLNYYVPSAYDAFNDELPARKT